MSDSCKLNPEYYRCGGIVVDDVIDAYGLNFRLGCALKYILRCGKKGDRAEDLGKAIRYLQRELKGEWQRGNAQRMDAV